jgi:signal transduction histidine kinase
MDREASFFVRFLALSARKRLALVLVAFVVCMVCYQLAYVASAEAYFSCLLILPPVCATWLFGWRGGLLSLAGVALSAGFYSMLAPTGVFWHDASLAVFIAGMLFGLVVCLVVAVLRRVTVALLDERQRVERLQRTYQQEHMLSEWKERIFQDLSHELRVPLTQTNGYLDLLETYQDSLDEATRTQFLSLARSGCDELLNLIRIAIETLHASDMRRPLTMSLFSLRQEVQAVLSLYESRLLQEHHVELEIPESVYVYADAGFVRQIMRNLLTNASKYTPAWTPIVVSADPADEADQPGEQAGMVCVHVRDYGPGIPPEQQASLFQRFVRLPNATKGKQPGSGLGLAICKQLIEAMGGTIRVESSGKDGEGCCFTFTLISGSVPCVDDQAETLPCEQPIQQYTVSSVRRDR